MELEKHLNEIISELKSKVTSAEDTIKKYQGYIKDIEGGYAGHGNKDHYVNGIATSEAYITGLKSSIREINCKKEELLSLTDKLYKEVTV